MAGEEQLQDRLKRLGQEVAANFTYKPRIQLQGFAGLGRHGGTIILREEASAEHEARLVVVKYSYGSLSPDQQSNADNDLRNEYYWLQRLRGAEHILQLMPMADCSINLPGTSNGEATYEEYIRLPDCPDELASRENLSGSALTLARLCCLGSGEDALKITNRSVIYQYTNDSDVLCTIQTRAPEVLRENQVIDPKLRHMLVKCLASSARAKPSLQEVLDETESAIRDENPDHQQLLTQEAINLGGSETDKYIREILYTFLYGRTR
ncbi:hypothetical protein F5B22DRAFT_649943 [Xylaria bambusicola]|uniref:uncharacterized protein n=1 Tax=Xylaria bambusicola TaxID=326684 RepID=UPI0020089087|nr:uncharacterized protein F5B22DRAFT_649943 [Xylaria bambusicola]KAI0508450.1 hypothetical protein F5B22DRAFT_649943 [Xylaria bambusicola]